MKKSLVLTLAALSVVSMAPAVHAQTNVPTVAPYTRTTGIMPPGEKQDAKRLDDCETQFQQQNLPESQHHSFLNTCVKNKLSVGSYATQPAAAPATPATSSPTAPASK